MIFLSLFISLIFRCNAFVRLFFSFSSANTISCFSFTSIARWCSRLLQIIAQPYFFSDTIRSNVKRIEFNKYSPSASSSFSIIIFSFCSCSNFPNSAYFTIFSSCSILEARSSFIFFSASNFFCKILFITHYLLLALDRLLQLLTQSIRHILLFLLQLILHLHFFLSQLFQSLFQIVSDVIFLLQ